MDRSQYSKGREGKSGDADNDSQTHSGSRSTFAPAQAAPNMGSRSSSLPVGQSAQPGTSGLRRSGAIGTASRSTSYRAMDASTRGHASRLSDSEYDRTMMERGLFSGRTGTNVLVPSQADSRTSLVGGDITSLDSAPLQHQQASEQSQTEQTIPRKPVGQGRRRLVIGGGRDNSHQSAAAAAAAADTTADVADGADDDAASFIRRAYRDPLTKAFGDLMDTESPTSGRASDDSERNY